MSGEKKIKLGALWRRQVRDQEKWSGEITVEGKKVRLEIWPNKWKKPGEKSPDLYIYEDTWEPNKARQAAPQTTVDDDDQLPDF